MMFPGNSLAAALVCAAAFFTAMPLSGQIEIQLSVDPVRAILYEQVNARVTIRNNTGGILAFGGESGSAGFFFELDRRRHHAVDRRDRSPLMSGTRLVPGGSVTNDFNLTSLYAIQVRGQYKLRAFVEWNGLLFASQPVDIEILNGFEIARIIAGVPGGEGASRTYILEYLGKEKGEQAYLRIEDTDGTAVYAMHRLGHIVRVRKPDIKVDEAGNVHVLYQTMAMIFVHTAFTPYGVQLFSRNYVDRSNKISLVNLPSGQITVEPMPPKDQISSGNVILPQEGSSNQPSAPGVRMGRGGLFGPKPQ
ncbi:MAG: hypothetical protein WC299_14280 [Kiritimatiellia bacterium]